MIADTSALIVILRGEEGAFAPARRHCSQCTIPMRSIRGALKLQWCIFRERARIVHGAVAGGLEGIFHPFQKAGEATTG